MGGTVEDFRSKAQDTYETAADRVSRASDVIRGEDSNALGTAAAALCRVWASGINGIG